MMVRLLALAFGLFLVAGTASAGPTPGGVDTDSDTVADAFDNCTAIPNPTQADTNHNGCGNACAPNCDTNGDDVIGIPDLGTVGSNVGNPVPPAPAAADCNGDTIVGIPDLGMVGSTLGAKAGPSGIRSFPCNPVSCNCTVN